VQLHGNANVGKIIRMGLERRVFSQGNGAVPKDLKELAHGCMRDHYRCTARKRSLLSHHAVPATADSKLRFTDKVALNIVHAVNLAYWCKLRKAAPVIHDLNERNTICNVRSIRGTTSQ